MRKITPAKILLAISVICMGIFISSILGCSSTKDLSKTDSQLTSKTRTDDSLKIVQLQSENAELTRMIREMESLEVTYRACPQVDTAAIRKLFSKECPPARVDSFIREVAVKTPTLKRDKDGNMEISGGNVESVKWSKKKEELVMSTIVSTVKTILESTANSVTEVSTRVQTKEVHKERSFMSSPWIWLIIGIVIGAVGTWRLIRWMDRFNDAKHLSTNQ